MISTKSYLQLYRNQKQEAYRTKMLAQSAPMGAAVSRTTKSFVLKRKKKKAHRLRCKHTA